MIRDLFLASLFCDPKIPLEDSEISRVLGYILIKGIIENISDEKIRLRLSNYYTKNYYT